MKKDTHKYDGVDFTNRRFGRLFVLRKNETGRTQWVCKCDCGNIVVLPAYRLFDYKSCGCLERENRKRLADYTRTHGMTNSRLYSVWCGMKDRCFNPNTEHYDRYGGRGISMCKEWKCSFENFRDWAYANGYEDSLTGKDQSIDRIDVNKDYCPENCRWVNQSQQMRNTSRAVFVQFNGKGVHIKDFCEINGITYPHFVFRRLAKGLSADQIIREWNFANGNHPGFWSAEEASSHYKVGYQSIKDWIDKGLLKAERVGQHWYIPKGQEVPRRSDRDSSGRFLKGTKRPNVIVSPT